MKLAACILITALLSSHAEAAISLDWTPHNITDTTAGGKGASRDGTSELQIGCNNLLGLEIYATLYDYPGSALRRLDDESEKVSFDVLSSGTLQSFPTRMHYVEWEKAWVLTDPLPIDFLKPFSGGQSLTIRNGAGGNVATFDLSGSAEVAAAMRRRCVE